MVNLKQYSIIFFIQKGKGKKMVQDGLHQYLHKPQQLKRSLYFITA
jgi:hypothetical protein